MSKDKSGPAFPVMEVTEYGTGSSVTHHTGISTRDYFAAKALLGLMARNWSHMQLRDADLMEVWVAGSYRMADLMIAESIK